MLRAAYETQHAPCFLSSPEIFLNPGLFLNTQTLNNCVPPSPQFLSSIALPFSLYTKASNLSRFLWKHYNEKYHPNLLWTDTQ